MCIFIDNTAYTDKHDAQTIFEYLFFLIRHLAIEQHYFKRIEYYDDFGIFGATRVYMRIVNKKQFDDNYKMKPIKGILNYLKSTLYPMKVDFEQCIYYQPLISETIDNSSIYNFDSIISSYYDFVSKTSFDLMLEGIGPICNECISEIPYTFDEVIKYNIITSVKLTLLNQLTLTRSSTAYIERLISNNTLHDINIEEAFSYIRDEVKLFHLDSSFKDYILILVRKMKSKIARELAEEISSNYIDYNLVDCIALNYRNEVNQVEDEYEFRT